MQKDHVFYSSLVTEYVVPKGRDFAFKAWHARLLNQAGRCAGFIRGDMCRPLRCKNSVVKWYSIMHFDSPGNLDGWVTSSDRKKLVELGRESLYAYRFKSFSTGLEGWFSGHLGRSERSGLQAATWKKILVVVVGLYPTVMLQSKLFSALDLFGFLPSASRILVNNLITSLILSLLVMPFVSRKFSFWLQPEYLIEARKNDVFGLIIVVIVLGVMTILFDVLDKISWKIM